MESRRRRERNSEWERRVKVSVEEIKTHCVLRRKRGIKKKRGRGRNRDREYGNQTDRIRNKG